MSFFRAILKKGTAAIGGPQSGACLASVMISLGIGSFITSIMAVTLTRAGKEVSVITDDADLRDLRLRLATVEDCVKTRAAHPTCNSPYINLIDGFGKNVVEKYISDAKVTKFSKYAVRAECHSRKLVIKVARNDKVNLGHFDWTNSRDLFPPKSSIIFTCPYP